MPDQSSAASEHALMQEITAPLETLPDDPLALVEADFPTSMRGYDRHAVDDYVEQVGRLVDELQATRSPEAAVRRALERVGEQISGILQRAHETAEQITGQSRVESEDRMEQARREAASIVNTAEQRMREIDADTDRIWAERQRIIADAEDLSGQLLSVARDAAGRFGAEVSRPQSATIVDAAVELPDVEPEPSDLEPEPAAEDPGIDQTIAFLAPAARGGLDADHPAVLRRGAAAPRALSALRVIDLMHLGRPRVIGAWYDDGVLVDCGPGSTLQTLLDGLGDERPRALLLTHIHFDHAGAAGALVRRWPDLQVYVHERGARHLAAPERLYDSARRLYGDDMGRLWGEMLPVPEENLHALAGGETVLDRYEVAYTPGHASHHVSYLRDGVAFVGDVGGVRITPEAITIPPTPPPDIDVELWHASVAAIRAWAPECLAMTHFGDARDVTAQLDELESRLDAWSRLARDGDRARFVSVVRQEILAQGSPEQAAQYEQAAPVELLYDGYERYWSKRAEVSRGGS